jgi:tetratricopeptide (TPR) repeat protein
MTFANGMSRPRDEWLDEVVVAYLEAVESGQTPDAREWLGRYPELAADLESFFADQDKVRRWTAPLRQAAGAPSPPAANLEATVDSSPHPALAGKLGRFGDYLLLEEIARGGMGIVYLAHQAPLQRTVAVKMILAGLMATATEIQRFHTEAVAAAALDHPNIVPIYEVGEVKGQHFYSMKMMEGGSLSDRIDQHSARPGEAAALLVKVAWAVHHAHQRGILHRDLKPGNVLLDGTGEPHVSDFGLAKRIEDGTHSGVVVGTPSYMAPEQAAGEKGLTTAADVYSLGAILYALLTGSPPFRADTRLETLKLLAEQAPVRPRALNPLVDHDLETICLKCLEKSPVQRYTSAANLAEDLQRYLAGEAIHARPTPLWMRAVKWAKRRPAAAALVALACGTVLSLLAGYLQEKDRRAAVAEQALKEGRRTSSLRKEVHDLIFQGRQALSQTQWSEARVHLTSARRLIAPEAALADLAEPVERLLAETEGRLRSEAARGEAEGKYRKFMELREHALFAGALFTGADRPTNARAIRATVEEALRLFGVALDTPVGPLFEAPFTQGEREEVKESCYELLLILADAVTHADRDGTKQALRILDRATRLGKPTRAYHWQRARYLKHLGEAAAASGESDRAAALQPAAALDYFLMGEELHRQGNVGEAIEAFRNALRIRPTHFWARYLLAVCYLRRQPARADLACDSLTACLAQRRTVPWVYLWRGMAHGQLELFGPAEEDFDRALRQPLNEDARYALFVNRGVLRSRQKRFPQAVADLKKAIAVKPTSYHAYANLAKVYQQQKQFAAALEQLDVAIDTARALVKAGRLEPPGLALLHRNRALLQLDRQDPAAALRDFHQAIAVAARGEDHAACGRILHDLKRFPEALLAYEAALQADAGHAGAHLGRARTLFALESYTEARRSLDRYLERPNPAAGATVLADVYRTRGLCGAKLGQYADAIADFTRALHLDDNSVTHAQRGWAYLVSKAPQLALPDFEKAIQLDENNGDAYNGRGAARVQLAVKLSQYQEATADAEQALSHGPRHDPRILWSAARIYAQAAARLDAERGYQVLKIAAHYREQALGLLRKALHLTPPSERSSFRRKYIQGDPDLARFAAAINSG